jgi:amidohydrolase
VKALPLSSAESLAGALTAWRRHLHRHPELGFQERQTAAYLDTELDRLGLAHREVAGTGRLVAIDSGRPGPVVLLRADLDALPIQEETGADYASVRAGVMHACGHDAHTACLLGALALLADPEGRPGRGRLLALFQPAEEPTPGGAERVVAEGSLERAGITAVLAQHVDHTLPVGTLGVRAGAMMARSDEFEVLFTGPGGHAADRDRCPDPLAAGSDFHVRLRELVPSAGGPESAADALVHIGRLQGGMAANVIPVEARLTGTLRTWEESAARRLGGELEALARRTARERNVQVAITWREGAPAVRNDPALTERLRGVWSAGLGIGRIQELAEPSLAAEDFGHLSARFPAVYWRLGIRGPERGGEPWHTPRFDVDEAALPVGAWALASAARALLETDP